MIYFGENNEYILCECETCKGEMYIERNAVSEEDAYAYHLYSPIKCRCGAIDEYINRSKKSCHSIKQELSALCDLLRKQHNVSYKISEITSELNRRLTAPSFLQSVGKDILFSFKVFLILLGSVIGVEIFLFIISSLMFFFGLVLQMPDLSKAGNELFYHINIFKDRGGALLAKFGLPDSFAPLNSETARSELIIGYIPYAIAGVIIIVFYIFLAVLILRVSVNVVKLTFFASKVVNRKIKINQKKEDYRRQIEDLGIIYQNITEKINEFTIIPPDYKNIRAAEAILKYFVNNRADTVREAVNLFHDEDFKNKLLEYNKAVYGEIKQTRRYTKALYMLTSDENIKVDVKDVREETPENGEAKVGEMLKDAFAKIKKSRSQKVSQISPPQPPASPVSKSENSSDVPANLNSESPDEAENDGDNAENMKNNENIDVNAIFDSAPQNEEK